MKRTAVIAMLASGLLLAGPSAALSLAEGIASQREVQAPAVTRAVKLSELGADVAPARARPVALPTRGEQFYAAEPEAPVTVPAATPPSAAKPLLRLQPPAAGAASAPPFAVTAREPVVPVLPTLSSADIPRVVDTLSLPRALEMVWAENPQVVEAEKAIEAAGFEVTGSYGGFLPSVTISNSTGRDGLSSVQASLPLWNGGLTLAQIDGSKAREVAARATLDRVRLTLGEQTLDAFYNLAQAQEQLRQWARYLTALERLRVSISNRANEGVATQSEVQTALSRMRQAEVGQEAARLLLLSSRNELAKLLRVSPASVQWGEDTAAGLAELQGVETETLLNRHPDVLLASAQVVEQDAVVKQARSRFSPEVALQYRTYYSGEAFDRTADAPQLVVQYQVGNGFTAYQQVSAEQSRAESARARLDVVKREVQTRLSATREQLLSSSRQFQLQKQASDSSQSLVESFLRQYQVGRRSWVEVLNAQREAHDNELGTISSRKAYALGAHQLALQMLAWDSLLRERGSVVETTTAAP